MNSAEESKERAICSGISLHKSVQDFNGGKWFFSTLKCIQESLIPSSQPWGLEPIAPGFRTLGSAGSTPGSVLLQHHSSSSSPQPCFVLGSLPWHSLEDIFKICLPLSKATQNDYLPAEGRADQWSLIMPFGWILLYYLSGNWLVLTALCFFKSVWEGLRTCSGRQQVEKACELPAAVLSRDWWRPSRARLLSSASNTVLGWAALCSWALWDQNRDHATLSRDTPALPQGPGWPLTSSHR